MSSEFEVRTSQCKMLAIVYLLAELGKAPSAQGIEDILHGELTDDDSFFTGNPLFGALRSFSSKRVKMQLNSLVKRGYLSTVSVDEETYYRPTDMGLDLAKRFLAKPLVKRKRSHDSKKKSIIDL